MIPFSSFSFSQVPVFIYTLNLIYNFLKMVPLSSFSVSQVPVFVYKFPRQFEFTWQVAEFLITFIFMGGKFKKRRVQTVLWDFSRVYEERRDGVM